MDAVSLPEPIKAPRPSTSAPEQRSSCASHSASGLTADPAESNAEMPLIPLSDVSASPCKRGPGKRRRHPVAKVKGNWNAEEDTRLVKLVGEHGEGNWSVIAKHFPGRIGKQCRERWHNQLRPDIKREAWSEDEEAQLIETHRRVGNRWADIAKVIEGRTENAVKNHWNATLRRKDSASHQDKGVSTLLKEYMRTLNLSMGKRKRSSADGASKGARSSPGDPMWAPGSGPRSSPPASPTAGETALQLRTSPVRALPSRERRKTLRLAEADDLEGVVVSGSDEEEIEVDNGDDAGLFGDLTPTFSRCVQAKQAGMSNGWDSPLTAVPRQLQMASLPLSSRAVPDAGSLAAYFPDEDKRRMWATSAAALLDHAGACSPMEAVLPSATHAMGLDADLENAMQWLNAEIGPVEDADKEPIMQSSTGSPQFRTTLLAEDLQLPSLPFACVQHKTGLPPLMCFDQLENGDSTDVEEFIHAAEADAEGLDGSLENSATYLPLLHQESSSRKSSMPSCVPAILSPNKLMPMSAPTLWQMAEAGKAMRASMTAEGMRQQNEALRWALRASTLASSPSGFHEAPDESTLFTASDESGARSICTTGVNSPTGSQQHSRPGTTHGRLSNSVSMGGSFCASRGSCSHDSSACWLPAASNEGRSCGMDLGMLKRPHVGQPYTPRNFIEVSAGPLQGLDIYLSRLAATDEEVATHCGRGPSFPASLMLEPRLHSQARVALAGICDVIRTSGACGGDAVGDMVIAVRTTTPSPGSDEATLVVAVAAPDWNHASFAMTQAVNLIKSLRF